MVKAKQRRWGFAISLVLLCIAFACQIKGDNTKKTPLDYVDPFICTLGDHGHWHPSALVPFGMVKFGADTYPSSLTGDGGWAHSGYNYADTLIRGFSHHHKGSSGGTAIYDRAGQLSILPLVDPQPAVLQSHTVAFEKSDESAVPGLYRVTLKPCGTTVELTATARVGLARIGFAAEEGSILLDAGNVPRTARLQFALDDSAQISGVLDRGGPVYYFVMRFNRPIRETRVWDGKSLQPGSRVDSRSSGLLIRFAVDPEKPLLVKTGISAVSLAGALKNLEAELPHWDFDQVVVQAQGLWSDILNRIEVEGEEEYKTIFYTALYHTCFLPTVTTDVDGMYPGLDKAAHRAVGYDHYDNFAFWDSYRTKYPLYSLILPRPYQDICRSILDIYRQVDNYAPFPDSDHKPHSSGLVAKGPGGYIPFETCRHEHMMAVVGDAFFKGLINFDMNAAYEGMRQEVMVQMPEKYDRIGYIPARPDQIQEYSMDNWILARTAEMLDKKEDADYFMRRAAYYRNSWDPDVAEVGFFRARAADGTWLDFPENPDMNREKYAYEGSKWHWRYAAVHDIPGLIELIGGREKFVKQLDYVFRTDLYNAGNQPGIHMPFLFNLAGAPWLTQKWTRAVLTDSMVQRYATHEFFDPPIYDRIYKATPDGYLREMDDDYGTMSSWYVLAAMGLYQVCLAEPVFQLSTPIFSKITIHLDSEFASTDRVVIVAQNQSDKNRYIQSATWIDKNGENRQTIDEPWVSFQKLTSGGTLILELGPEPNRQWGADAGEGWRELHPFRPEKILDHSVVLDSEDKLLPWSAFDTILSRSMAFLFDCPTVKTRFGQDPWYLVTAKFSPDGKLKKKTEQFRQQCLLERSNRCEVYGL